MAAGEPAPQELLEIAVSAARAAGELLAARGEEVEVAATKSSPTDVVTEMDRRSEQLITSLILGLRPGDAILAEEGGESAPAAGSAAVRWVIDPLDGTVNYLYGLPDWAVSIAAESGGRVVAGVVHQPRRGETFTATLGGGSWLAEASRAAPAALRARPAAALDRALVATGFGYRAERRAVQGEVVAALLPMVRDIRRGGSAAIDLCSVAAGRVDAYFERGLNPWDYAAGALIAAEAGAVVAGLSGPAGPQMTIAAPGPAVRGAKRRPGGPEGRARLDKGRRPAARGGGAAGWAAARRADRAWRGCELALTVYPRAEYMLGTGGLPRPATVPRGHGRPTRSPRMRIGAERGRIPRRNRAQLRRPERYTRAATAHSLTEGDGSPRWLLTTTARERPTMT